MARKIKNLTFNHGLVQPSKENTQKNRVKTVDKLSKENQIDLSIVMIGHNEAHHLIELLPRLSWVKEIIYVDCESTDQSVKVAKDCKCKVFKRKNSMNPLPLSGGGNSAQFGIAENKSFAIGQARFKWILLLDPDERLTDELVAKIKTIVKDSQIGGYYINRKNFYLRKFLKYGGNYPDWQLRLFQKKLAFFSHLNVHEHLEIREKPTSRLANATMLHYTYDSIFELLKKNNVYSSFEVQAIVGDQKLKKIMGGGAFLNFMLIKPIGNFINRYFFKLGFLDGFEGFIYCFFNAFKFQLRYLKFKESLVKSKNTIKQ